MLQWKKRCQEHTVPLSYRHGVTLKTRNPCRLLNSKSKGFLRAHRWLHKGRNSFNNISSCWEAQWFLTSLLLVFFFSFFPSLLCQTAANSIHSTMVLCVNSCQITLFLADHKFAVKHQSKVPKEYINHTFLSSDD